MWWVLDKKKVSHRQTDVIKDMENRVVTRVRTMEKRLRFFFFFKILFFYTTQESAFNSEHSTLDMDEFSRHIQGKV